MLVLPSAAQRQKNRELNLKPKEKKKKRKNEIKAIIAGKKIGTKT